MGIEQNKHHYVAIMAGGIGSRFWPKSRTSFPKQFLDILNTGKTLIQWTFERYRAFIPLENIYIVTSTDYTDIVAQQLPDLPAENIVSEPCRKNTAPCIAYIAFKLLKKDPEASLVVAPSDHLILGDDRFRSIILSALKFVESTLSFVTLGIKPSGPNTGYGYIQYQTDTTSTVDGSEVCRVKTFTEKPDLELARTFLESGDFLWNAGIFIWKIAPLIEAFQKYQPEIYELFDASRALLNTQQEAQVIKDVYERCKSISIDYAIMEKAENVFVIPSDFGWSDLGTWNSAYENVEKDYLGNAVIGKHVLVIDATRCMVSAPENKLVVLQGLDDCIVVDTQDVLLVCKKDKEQDIKAYVSEVKRKEGDQFI